MRIGSKNRELLPEDSSDDAICSLSGNDATDYCQKAGKKIDISECLLTQITFKKLRIKSNDIKLISLGIRRMSDCKMFAFDPKLIQWTNKT